MEIVKRRASLLTLLLLFVLCVVVGASIYGNQRARSQPTRSAGQTVQNATSPSYLYYVLKASNGFVLARAHRGNARQPVGAPQVIAPISPGFGQSEADAVLALQLSPDGRYLLIDGTRPDAEQVWIYDTQKMKINLLPADAQGNFLRWLPNGNRHTFLFRPMFPVGAVSPTGMQAWRATLWLVNAATSAHSSIDLHTPAANLVDAAPSPDGKHIIYSTSSGLSLGSDTWLANSNGGARKHLFKNSGILAIDALFAWSPDGKHVAYERLADSATPFLNAGLWLMNADGKQRQRLAAADGGHGYALSWSSDSRKVAFITRTNPHDALANVQAQSLQSAIAVVDIVSKKVSLVASTRETGMQLNINPAWTDHNTHITFTALNAPNRVLGGTLHYWWVPINKAQVHPATISVAITHVVAVS
jgi:Tol biopolymer transport system component